VQTVHRDGSKLRHKANSPETRQIPLSLEHEVIYVIERGFISRGASNNARKRHAREILIAMHGRRNYVSVKRKPLLLIFDDNDLDILIIPNHDDPLLVKAFINNKEVHRLLVGISSFANVMFYGFFRNLRIPQSEMVPYNEDLIGFSSYHINLIGYVKL